MTKAIKRKKVKPLSARAIKSAAKKQARIKAAKIASAIGRANILTAFEEASLPLPPKLLREFRVAVGLPARMQAADSESSLRRLKRLGKIPTSDRHRLFYEFWDEYFDFKVEVVEQHDESPIWLKRVADEIANEIDWDL